MYKNKMKKYEILDLSNTINNKIILMFSGGYDSTCLLLNLINSGCKHIKCAYIDIPNNKDKSKIEIKRCKKILKVIKKQFNVKIPFKIYKSMKIVDQGNNVIYGQPYLFLATIIPVISKDTDYILFGFHRVSNIWHTYTIFEDSLRSMMRLVRCERYNNSEYNTLIYCPYEFREKKDIIKYLKQYKKIYRLCWTCENPIDGKECGKCKPCKTIKRYR